jgi:transcriptional regulator with XRE-family HTH domain
MNIGKAIKLCRTSKNVRLLDVAQKTGLSISYLSLVEQGKREANFKILEKISSALDIPMSILIFLGSDNSEFKEISPELYIKFSTLAMELISNKAIE